MKKFGREKSERRNGVNYDFPREEKRKRLCYVKRMRFQVRKKVKMSKKQREMTMRVKKRVIVRSREKNKRV